MLATLLFSSGWLLGAAHAAVPSAPGDLTVTEFMSNPTSVADYVGEWFEIHNPTGEAMDLNGLRITGDSPDAGFTVTGSLIVPAGGYVVFGINDCDNYSLCTSKGPNRYNGGVVIDYLYDQSDLDLNEDGDRISLLAPSSTTVIDELEWDSTWLEITENASLRANINAFDLEWANDLRSNWCASDTVYGGVLMKGTPGAANPPCDGSTSDDDGDGFTEANGDCDDSDPAINPDAVDGDQIAPECPEALAVTGATDDDADCDGVRDDGTTDDDGDGFTEEEGDCDDDDPTASPAGVEGSAPNAVDNDCNGEYDDDDADGDGYSEFPAWYSVCEEDPDLGFDCDDTDAGINPLEADVPYDGLDNDCDGYDVCDVDEDGYLADPDIVCPGENCCTVAEFAGHPDAPFDAGDCDDNNAEVNPGGSEGDPTDGGFADGLDNDCSGVADEPYEDADGDGVAAADGDCLDDPDDPMSALVYPGQPEICGDKYDNDCDGLYDDNCASTAQYASIQGGPSCAAAGTAASGGLLAGLALLAGLLRRRRNQTEERA